MSAPASKPLSLQSPEHIAQEYGGNKQKIAQAVQMGVIDPTSGLMAGMFIDRMRAAQAQEQAPHQTVAQQVLGPQGPQGGPPQGGLGGLPPGGQGPQGGPPPGAPPMQMASAAPPPGGPPPQGPVGMAGGGLTTLPVPDAMFDEHTFAGGGIVAFSTGNEVGGYTYQDASRGISSSDPATRAMAAAWLRNYQTKQSKPYVAPDLSPATADQNRLVGMYAAANDQNATDQQRNEARQAIYAQGQQEQTVPVVAPATASPTSLADIAPPGTPIVAPTAAPRPTIADIARSAATAKNVPTPTPRPDLPTDVAATPVESLEALQARMKGLYGAAPTPDKTSAEDKAARKKEDLYSALAQAGFSMMAGTSQNALTNIGEGFKAAIPTMQASLKERRADEKEERAQAFAAKVAAHTDNVSAANAAYTMYHDASKDKQDALDKQLEREVQTAGQQVQRDVGMAQVNKRSAEDNAQAIILAGAGPNATPAQQAAAKALMDYRAAGAMMTGGNTQANNYAVQKAKVDERFDASIKRETLAKNMTKVAQLNKDKRAAMDVLNLLYPNAAERLDTPTGKTQQIGRFAVSESGN